MMTFHLADSGVLRPERGDVVQFGITSAEHPGTYEFARTVQGPLQRDMLTCRIWAHVRVYCVARRARILWLIGACEVRYG